MENFMLHPYPKKGTCIKMAQLQVTQLYYSIEKCSLMQNTI